MEQEEKQLTSTPTKTEPDESSKVPITSQIPRYRGIRSLKNSKTTLSDDRCSNTASPTNFTNSNEPGGPNSTEYSKLEDTSDIHQKISNKPFETNLSPIHSHKKLSTILNSGETLKRHIEKNISVAVRIRPRIERENGSENMFTIRDKTLKVTTDDNLKFNLDYIFQSFDEDASDYCSQSKIYECIGAPLLESAFKGYNVCLLAYGKTGSGKSFSMIGRNNSDIEELTQYSGIIPRFCRDLIACSNNLPNNNYVDMKISYFEVYDERINDLLTDGNSKRIELKVRENPNFKFFVENLTLKPVTTYDSIKQWLSSGNEKRANAATDMNEKSSMSHSIFKIDMNFLNGSNEYNRSIRTSSVCFVDLADINELHPAESANLNKSFFTLSEVISSLANKDAFIPYRNSVLTKLLHDNLGGNSLTTILTTISPSVLCIDETVATLRLACSAKKIVNLPQINDNPQEKVIRALTMVISQKNKSESSLRIECNGCKNKEEIQNQLDETKKEHKEAELSWKRKYEEAEISWQQKFEEAELKNSVELAKWREKCESTERILSYSNKSIDSYGYECESNFLEDLANILEYKGMN